MSDGQGENDVLYKVRIGKGHITIQSRSSASLFRPRDKLPLVPPKELSHLQHQSIPAQSTTGAEIAVTRNSTSSSCDAGSPVRKRISGPVVSSAPPRLELPEKNLPLEPSFNLSRSSSMAIYHRIEQSPPQGNRPSAQIFESDLLTASEMRLSSVNRNDRWILEELKLHTTVPEERKPLIFKDTTFEVQRVDMKPGLDMAGRVDKTHQYSKNDESASDNIAGHHQSLSAQPCKHSMKMRKLLRPHPDPVQMLCNCQVVQSQVAPIVTETVQVPQEITSLPSKLKEKVRRRFGHKSEHGSPKRAETEKESINKSDEILDLDAVSEKAEAAHRSKSSVPSSRGGDDIRSFTQECEEIFSSGDKPFGLTPQPNLIQLGTSHEQGLTTQDNTIPRQTNMPKPFRVFFFPKPSKKEASLKEHARPATSHGTSSPSSIQRPRAITHPFAKARVGRTEQQLPPSIRDRDLATASIIENNLTWGTFGGSPIRSYVDTRPATSAGAPTGNTLRRVTSNDTIADIEAQCGKQPKHAVDTRDSELRDSHVSSTSSKHILGSPPTRPLPKIPDTTPPSKTGDCPSDFKKSPSALTKKPSVRAESTVTNNTIHRDGTHSTSNTMPQKQNSETSTETHRASSDTTGIQPVTPQMGIMTESLSCSSSDSDSVQPMFAVKRGSPPSPREQRVRDRRQKDLRSYSTINTVCTQAGHGMDMLCESVSPSGGLKHVPTESNSPQPTTASTSNKTELQHSNIMVLCDSDPVTNQFRAGAISPSSSAKKARRSPTSKRNKRRTGSVDQWSSTSDESSCVEQAREMCKTSLPRNAMTPSPASRRLPSPVRQEDQTLGSSDDEKPLSSLHHSRRRSRDQNRRRRWNSSDIRDIKLLEEQLDSYYKQVAAQSEQIKRLESERQMAKRIMQSMTTSYGLNVSFSSDDTEDQSSVLNGGSKILKRPHINPRTTSIPRRTVPIEAISRPVSNSSSATLTTHYSHQSGSESGIGSPADSFSCGYENNSIVHGLGFEAQIKTLTKLDDTYGASRPRVRHTSSSDSGSINSNRSGSESGNASSQSSVQVSSFPVPPCTSAVRSIPPSRQSNQPPSYHRVVSIPSSPHSDANFSHYISDSEDEIETRKTYIHKYSPSIRRHVQIDGPKVVRSPEDRKGLCINHILTTTEQMDRVIDQLVSTN